MKPFTTLLLLLCVPAVGDITIVTTGSGTVTTPSVEILSEKNSLLLRHQKGTETVTLPCDEIVEIRFPEQPAGKPPSGSIEIERATGDRIIGVLLDGATANHVKVKSPLLGEREVPLDQIRALRSLSASAAAPEIPTSLPEDLVLTRSGDRGKGYVVSVDPAKLVYHSSTRDADVTLPLEEVSAVFLSATQPPPAPPKTLFAIATGRDGSSLQGPVQSLREGSLQITDLYGTTHSIDVSRIASLHFRNGRTVYLSDLLPAVVDENANYIRAERPLPGDLNFPWKADLNVKGGPLTLQGVVHRKGIGVHSYSSLTYALEGGFRRFQATVGLDDSGRRIGNVLFQVWCDDTKKEEKKIDAADLPQEMDVDVAGVRNLRLVVDFGERASQGDVADWASARLIR